MTARPLIFAMITRLRSWLRSEPRPLVPTQLNSARKWQNFSRNHQSRDRQGAVRLAFRTHLFGSGYAGLRSGRFRKGGALLFAAILTLPLSAQAPFTIERSSIPGVRAYLAPNVPPVR